MPRNEWTNSSASPRRRRFQRGSLQKRKSAGSWNWIVFWWQDHRRRGQILGPCSTMSRPEALAEMATLLQPVNIHAGERISRTWTVANWIRDMFLPLCRRKCSTASTTGDRIRKHLITQPHARTRKCICGVKRNRRQDWDACLADHLTADIILYAVRKRIIS